MLNVITIIHVETHQCIYRINNKNLQLVSLRLGKRPVPRCRYILSLFAQK